jgi:hypothetical protein
VARGAPHDRAGPTAARSSPSPRPSRAGIGVRVVAGAARASPTPAPSSPTPSPRPSPRRATTPASPSPTTSTGLAEPDGVAPPDLDLYRAELAELPTEAKVARALELERLVKARDPRISGVRVAMWATASARPRWSPAPASGLGPVQPLLGRRCRPSPWRATETQIGSGVSVGRHPRRDLDLDRGRRRRRRAGHPPARLPQGPLPEAHHRARPRRHLGASSASSAAPSTARPCSRAARCSPTGWASRSRRRC